MNDGTGRLVLRFGFFRLPVEARQGLERISIAGIGEIQSSSACLAREPDNEKDFDPAFEIKRKEKPERALPGKFNDVADRWIHCLGDDYFCLGPAVREPLAF